jgi:hypothetical protein
MSLLGRLDTKVMVYRSAENTATDKYGDANASTLEPLTDKHFHGAFHSPRGRTSDQGAGEYSGQKMMFFCNAKTDIKLGDVIRVLGGVDPGSPAWLVCGSPYRPANKHCECLVQPFYGVMPTEEVV